MNKPYTQLTTLLRPILCQVRFAIYTLTAVTTLTVVSPLQAESTAVVLDASPEAFFLPSNGNFGWGFTPTKNILVNALGFFDRDADGFAVAHSIGIWDADQNLLISGIVPDGAAAPLTDHFRYVNVSPTMLNANESYRIAATNPTTGGDSFLSNSTTFAFHPAITFQGPRWRQGDSKADLGSALHYPSSGASADVYNYFGPNFQFTVVPEPSSLPLLFVAAGLAWRCRPRRRPARARTARVLAIACCACVAVAIAISPTIASAAAVRTVAISGQPAPGTTGAVVFDNFLGTGNKGPKPFPSLNNAGHVAFAAILSGDGVDDGNDNGLWSEGSGTLHLVARFGDPAPGLPEGEVFGSLGFPPALNAAGQTAFDSSLGKSKSGLWVESLGNANFVAGLGMQAPGTSIGTEFTSLSRPALNDAGQTAFRGALVGDDVDETNGDGIWSEGSGSLALVARTGSPAPGTSQDYAALGSPVLNALGHVAFAGNLVNTSAGHGLYEAIWSEGGGGLSLVARQGDQPPGTPGGVEFDRFREPTFNSAGQTAFRATLSGAIVEGVDELGIWSEGSGSLQLVARAGSQAVGMPGGIHYVDFDGVSLNSAGETAFIAKLSSSGPTGIDYGVWSGTFDTLTLVTSTGSPAPGTPSGFLFNGFLLSALNAAGQVAFIGSATDGEEYIGGLWATDVTGTLRLIVHEGAQLEVAPGDFRTVDALGFGDGTGIGNGTGDGLPSSFNDRGQVAFWARFTDESTGIFVSNAAAVPEPTSLGLLVATSLIALRRRTRQKMSGTPSLCAGLPTPHNRLTAGLQTAAACNAARTQSAPVHF